MQYFGVPRCPYCKKRVNLLRTWSLKRQGEYQCPRCGGISNIYLSPLIYVFALLAVFAGGALYFFQKFVLDSISLSTLLQVTVPFAAFFLLSLFMVYLEKPVIKQVSREEAAKRRRPLNAPAGAPRRGPEQAERRTSADRRAFYDDQEYLPKTDYRTGAVTPREDDRDMKVLPEPAPRKAPAGAAAREEVPTARRAAVFRPEIASSAASAERPASRPAAPSGGNEVYSASAPGRTAGPAVEGSPVREAPAARSASAVGNDIFARYDDPEYVERRLRELQEKKNGR